jgi:hypothetical protein
MKRLYFMLPDNDTCKKVVEELENAGIPQRHLHAIASLTVSLEGLPEASVIQKSELAHGIEKGVALGGAGGLLGGLLAVAFPPAGLVIGGGALLMTAAAGAGFGALVTGLISKDLHNRKFDAFEEDLSHGKILLLVDVPKKETEDYKKLILGHHPDADISVTDVPGKQPL